MARRDVRLNGPGDCVVLVRDHDEDRAGFDWEGDDGGASLDLGLAAAPRDRHLSRGRFRWSSRGRGQRNRVHRAHPKSGPSWGPYPSRQGLEGYLSLPVSKF